jgi:cellulose synthase/poly-beta-1,6-N-acetylglucosamine synthase-like glycosyltransferase
MIIRLLRRPASRNDTPDELACSCGHRYRAGAHYCRRCGAFVGDPSIMPIPQAASALTGPTPGRLPELRRPTGVTASLVRSRRRDVRRGTKQVQHRVLEVPDEQSARRTLTRPQIVVVRFLAAVVGMALVVNLTFAVTALVALATLLYVGALVFRLRIFARALKAPEVLTVSDAEARAIWDRSLPNYTVLVPAYQEPEVIGDLIRQLDRLEYPTDRLDIKLLLEEDDVETLRAAQAAMSGPQYEIVRVPYSEPRTKPKALNVGLRRARGRRGQGLVTIYDVEDRPDPLQLRRAVAAFRQLGPSIACLQAKLAYHNANQNIITRWFTVEYSMWFGQLLPGLVALRAPLPLGGTSNHFRREVLEALGGWDPYNVTEDADLGIRLHRAGYRTGVLDSVTYEEANSDFVNWIKQRSRWYKGYLQTWLVHMRNPAQLWRDLGPRGFIGFNLFVGGTPLLALINPVFWGMALLWFVAHPAWIAALFPGWLYYVSLVCLVFGNFAFVYTTMVAARVADRPKLVIASVLSPAYWGMMSIAAIKAVMQLVNAPSFWEKTFHGLDRGDSTEMPERAAA